MMFFKKRNKHIRSEKINMTEERKVEIEEIVNKKLEDYSLYTPKFDLIQFLKNEEGFKITWQDMEDDTTGFILINDEDHIPTTKTHKLIAVNSKLRPEPNFIQRRRFIVAHEYAHSILHKKDERLYAHRDISHRNDEIEQEADFFARCFLMPKVLVEALINEDTANGVNEIGKIKHIAETFNVTEKKARQRFEELTSE